MSVKRITYTYEQLKKLLEYIEPFRSGVSLDNIPYSGRMLYLHIGMLVDIETPYEEEQLYQAIKRDSMEIVTQVMYHTPHRKLPLLINHPSPLLKAIVKWRLNIGR